MFEQFDADHRHAQSDGAHASTARGSRHGAEVAAIEEFTHARLVGGAMCQAPDVVAQQNFHARDFEPRETRGVRAHHRIVAIVKDRREGPRGKVTFAPFVRVLRTRGHHAAAHLGRNHRPR